MGTWIRGTLWGKGISGTLARSLSKRSWPAEVGKLLRILNKQKHVNENFTHTTKLLLDSNDNECSKTKTTKKCQQSACQQVIFNTNWIHIFC